MPRTTNASPKEEVAAEPVPSEPRKRYIDGQIVVADGMRTVGEATFHHITLADGSQMDLIPAEYLAKVKIAYPPNA